jgi:hypothetical protein
MADTHGGPNWRKRCEGLKFSMIELLRVYFANGTGFLGQRLLGYAVRCQRP